jgi:hypothetical protein
LISHIFKVQLLKNSQQKMKLLSFFLLSQMGAAQPPMQQQSTGDVCESDGSSFRIFVTTDATKRTIDTSGCPEYDWTSQTTDIDAMDQSAKWTMPLNPTFCKEPTYIGAYFDIDKTTANTDIALGPVGVAFNGVVIFGNSDMQGRDAYVFEGHTLDQCNGHAAPDGSYHYHTQIPNDCLGGQAVEDSTHAKLVGFMADGIPIYGPEGDDGVIPEDLDECNGHTDNAHAFYHYHVASEYQYPYTVNCLRGKTDRSFFSNSCEEDESVQYDYSELTDALKDTNTEASELDDAVNDANTESSGSPYSNVNCALSITFTALMHQLWFA